MNEIEIIIILILVAVGSFLVAVGSYCAGMLAESKQVLFWKIEWIKVEHKLALLEDREPRECADKEKHEPEKA